MFHVRTLRPLSRARGRRRRRVVVVIVVGGVVVVVVGGGRSSSRAARRSLGHCLLVGCDGALGCDGCDPVAQVFAEYRGKGPGGGLDLIAGFQVGAMAKQIHTSTILAHRQWRIA